MVRVLYHAPAMSDTWGEPQQSLEGEVVSHAYDGPGEWVPIARAALNLGISERTLRRRLDNPDPPYRERLIDRKTHVFMPTVSGIPPDTPSATGKEPDSAALAVPDKTDTLGLALIEELTQRRVSDTETISRLTARLTELERENAVLQDRLTPWWRRWLSALRS